MMTVCCQKAAPKRWPLSKISMTNGPTMTTLVLESNSIGAKGGIAIAEALKVNTTLTSLDLRSNSLDDQAKADLRSAASSTLKLEF